jgi:hypothetical protein
MMRAILAAVLAVIPVTAFAVDANECELQRAQYPKAWNDVSQEKALFFCVSHYSGAVKITLGAADGAGRHLMSVVPLDGKEDGAKQDPAKDVYRIWLDREQTGRLLSGRYFGSIVRQQSSCWIRGALSADDDKQDSVFFMDNADPAADGIRSGAGSFYNKAPRLSVFQGDAYDCKPIK